MDNPEYVKKKKTKTIILVVIVVVVVLLVGGIVVYLKYFSKTSPVVSQNKPIADNKIVNKLDGTKVDPALANRHPLAIMIENHPDARPQSGLDKASIVYEAITEGGITRFMAIYGPNDASKVGPVRSARIYFIDWLKEFNAYYAHVGGNLDALDKIKNDNVLDLDQFGLGDKAYWRIPQAGKAIEHTMYTSTDKLYQAARDKKYTTDNNFTPLLFVAPTPLAQLPNGQKATIKFSSPQYDVSWTYDKSTNTYLRSLANAPHLDAVTGNQLRSTNIIIQQMARKPAITAINEDGWSMSTIGTDKAIILSQGTEIDGTWQKVDQSSRTKFYDASGKEISFTPGQFWIEIVPPDIFPSIKIADILPPAAQ